MWIYEVPGKCSAPKFSQIQSNSVPTCRSPEILPVLAPGKDRTGYDFFALYDAHFIKSGSRANLGLDRNTSPGMSRFLAQWVATREWVWWRGGFGDDLRLGE
jgi:hypothetical protein